MNGHRDVGIYRGKIRPSSDSSLSNGPYDLINSKHTVIDKHHIDSKDSFRHLENKKEKRVLLNKQQDRQNNNNNNNDSESRECHQGEKEEVFFAPVVVAEAGECVPRQYHNTTVEHQSTKEVQRVRRKELDRCKEVCMTYEKEIADCKCAIDNYTAQLRTVDVLRKNEIIELEELMDKKRALHEEYTNRILRANTEIVNSKRFILECEAEKHTVKDAQILSKINQCLAFIPSNYLGACCDVPVTCEDIGRSLGPRRKTEDDREDVQTALLGRKEVNFNHDDQQNDNVIAMNRVAPRYPSEEEKEENKKEEIIRSPAEYTTQAESEVSVTFNDNMKQAHRDRVDDMFERPSNSCRKLNRCPEEDCTSHKVCAYSDDMNSSQGLNAVQPVELEISTYPQVKNVDTRSAGQRGVRSLVQAIRTLNSLPPTAGVNRVLL